MSDQPQHTFVIAEAGVNHNGSLARALQLVSVAAEAGADAIKFQTFKANRIAAASAPKAAYQSRNTGYDGGQVAMLKSLELSDQDHRDLAKACEDASIEFMSTPFDEYSATFLVNDIGVRRLKVASGELTNAPLLLHLAHTGKPIVLSTGMATLDEVKIALGILAFGYMDCSLLQPSTKDFLAAFENDRGQNCLKANVTLLHCTSNYPAAPDTINLRAMDTLYANFGLPVGLSDHSQGIAVPTAAVSRGAAVIEKHFTLDRKLEGPDHAASLEPNELRAMIAAVRNVEVALGSGLKVPTAAEKNTASVARKSLVALTEIMADEAFTADNLGVKRPGTGISPLEYWSYLGQPAARAYGRDELIEPQ